MAEHEILIRVVVEQLSAVSAPPEDDFTEVKGKEYTSSQLLRFALRRAFDKEPTVDGWEYYYRMRMARIIDVIDKQTGK